MSVRYMAQVWELDMDSSAKLILLAFADHANDEGRTFPSISRVAWKCGCSPRTVRRHVASLKDAGVLVSLAFEHGGKRSTIYQIHPEKAEALPPYEKPKEGGDNLSFESDEDGRECHPTPDMGGRRPRTPMSAEPSVNHQLTITEERSASNGTGDVQELVAWWVDRQIVKPAPEDVGKQGAVAKRLIAKYGTDGVRMAVAGMGHLFPHSNGEPWDLMDLERKFLKAAQALVTSDPRTKAHSARNRILDRIKGAR